MLMSHAAVRFYTRDAWPRAAHEARVRSDRHGASLSGQRKEKLIELSRAWEVARGSRPRKVLWQTGHTRDTHIWYRLRALSQ